MRDDGITGYQAKTTQFIFAGTGSVHLGLCVCSTEHRRGCGRSKILTVDHYVYLVDSVRMACIQFLVCGITSAIPMIFVDMGVSASEISAWVAAFTDPYAWIPILYAGVLSCGYTLQIIGQRGMNPTVASLLMSLESVFSVLAGWMLLNEALSGREILGCILIFIAVVLAQL